MGYFFYTFADRYCSYLSREIWYHALTMKYLLGLNQEQRRAVEHTGGPLMIIAGAGTGKTRVITHRIVHLIAGGTLPSNILAVTFTNKAAQEMRDRVRILLTQHLPHSLIHDVPGYGPFIGTFHSLGVRILRENARKTERAQHFSIFDRDDSISLIKHILKDLAMDPKKYSPGMILSLISRQKGEGFSLNAFKEERVSDFFSQIIASVWERYDASLTRENAFDFDDLLLKTVELLSQHPEVKKQYQNMWSHIHVDEYQDTNMVQYKLIRLLSEGNDNVCVVGDHDQCIYTWRSADIRNLSRFEEDYYHPTIILLEENYRSTQNILSAANESIRLNIFRKDKELFTKEPAGEKIHLYTALDETDEAYHVAQTAQNLIHDGVSPQDIAILFRANFQSRALEEAFLSLSVPYQVLGVRFFERKEVKDVLSYIHASFNLQSSVHLTRVINVPSRGIGKATILKVLAGQEYTLSASMREKVRTFTNLLERIKEKALHAKPSETIKYILKETGLEHELSVGGDEDLERLGNIKELATLAARYDALPVPEGIHTFLEEATLASDQDALKKDEKSVKLMTIHAAKGLEFDHVCIVGLEEGLFPSERSEMRETPEEREEERRLFYVALTRARKQLHLSYAHIRTIFGSARVNIPSRFIADIAPELMLDVTPSDELHENSGLNRKGLLDIDF